MATLGTIPCPICQEPLRMVVLSEGKAAGTSTYEIRVGWDPASARHLQDHNPDGDGGEPMPRPEQEEAA